MDGHRFDNVARAFARRNSRRSLLGGIAGSSALFLATHLRLPGAAARRNTKYAGQACWDDSQCVAADTALVCAWNGYGSAGMACCAYEGSRCGDDAGCCGTSLCLGGFCGSSVPVGCRMLRVFALQRPGSLHPPRVARSRRGAGVVRRAAPAPMTGRREQHRG
jgi:hypothetical protein